MPLTQGTSPIQTVGDTNSVDLTITGSNLTADSKISATAGNQISIAADGLLVPASGSTFITAVSDTATIDLTVTGSTLSADLIAPTNTLTTTLPFGGSFTDKAQTVVTGQTWVTLTSKIVTKVLTPAGTDPDEMRLLDFNPVVSDLVAGTGFTVTLYSEPEAQGDYDIMCIGM